MMVFMTTRNADSFSLNRDVDGFYDCIYDFL